MNMATTTEQNIKEQQRELQALQAEFAREQEEEAYKRAPNTVMLLAATRTEIDPTIDALGLNADGDGDAHVGRYGKIKIVAAVTGIGAARATSTFHRIVRSHKAQLVINIGFAGGLDPALITGDVVNFRCILNGRGKIIRFSDGVPYVAVDDGHRETYHTLVTSSKLVFSTEKKERLLKRHRAGAVDMESFAIAEAAAMSEVRLMVIRAISDAAHEHLPKESELWINEDGSTNKRAVTRYLATHPWKFGDIMHLGKEAKLAGRKLADRVKKIVTKAAEGRKQRKDSD